MKYTQQLDGCVYKIYIQINQSISANVSWHCLVSLISSYLVVVCCLAPWYAGFEFLKPTQKKKNNQFILGNDWICILHFVHYIFHINFLRLKNICILIFQNKQFVAYKNARSVDSDLRGVALYTQQIALRLALHIVIFHICILYKFLKVF
jgi:hypothetical protein